MSKLTDPSENENEMPQPLENAPRDASRVRIVVRDGALIAQVQWDSGDWDDVQGAGDSSFWGAIEEAWESAVLDGEPREYRRAALAGLQNWRGERARQLEGDQ